MKLKNFNLLLNSEILIKKIIDKLSKYRDLYISKFEQKLLNLKEMTYEYNIHLINNNEV